MCLAIPGKLISLNNDSTPKMGIVSFGGIQKNICMEWLPEAAVGDYVIVHVGFALSRLDEAEALETIRMFEKMGEGLDELDTPPEGR
ncbi:MAG: HypC/HybG/HupF family hydrogenase formation chaperone [Bacteroidetes bacterium]|jgi:hydrogenase expression/formation protein HypC|nr:HypC/HybG/HupF family hydrogenase formation chaperone [Bacteroidota bacterium]